MIFCSFLGFLQVIQLLKKIGTKSSRLFFGVYIPSRLNLRDQSNLSLMETDGPSSIMWFEYQPKDPKDVLNSSDIVENINVSLAEVVLNAYF